MEEPNWLELMEQAAFGLDAPKPKAKPRTVPVSTWSSHRCDSNHRSASSFLKCALDKYHQNTGGFWTKPTVDFSGSGDWAVVHRGYSGDYYTQHNGKSRNRGYFYYDIYLFETYEEAEAKHLYLAGGGCYDDNCSPVTGGCRGLESKIVKVKLS